MSHSCFSPGTQTASTAVAAQNFGTIAQIVMPLKPDGVDDYLKPLAAPVADTKITAMPVAHHRSEGIDPAFSSCER